MSEKLYLQWNDFKDNLTSVFTNLREGHDFADVTLACEDGQQVEAHKVILAASSPVFGNILRRNKHIHPLIYMKGLKSDDLSAIIDFLYRGETRVHQDSLDSFLAIAHDLQLKGLVGNAADTEIAEMTSKETLQKPEKDTVQKKEMNFLKSAHSSSVQDSIIENYPDIGGGNAGGTLRGTVSGTVGGTVSGAVGGTLVGTVEKKSFSGDLAELEEKTTSMMKKTSRKNSTLLPIYSCKVCGKEDVNANIRSHIESNHLDGISIPCNICEKNFRCKKSLIRHNRHNHLIPLGLGRF